MILKRLNIRHAGSRKFVQISEDFNSVELIELLKELRKNNVPFEIYDPLYPTSPDDDQGAYICYSLEKSTDSSCWSMTLGNHGWSGGIYQIPEKIILIQLNNLIKRKLLKEIQTSNVSFFSHYDSESLSKNQKMIQIIENAHKAKQ